jgi:hypothetical protein
MVFEFQPAPPEVPEPLIFLDLEPVTSQGSGAELGQGKG